MIHNAYDITIIGGGPVGMYASFYAAMRKLKVKIIDALPSLGGQLQAIYPEKYIYDIPGVSKIFAKDLIKNLKTQMDDIGENIDIVLNETVEYVRRNEDENIFEICTDKLCHYTKTVLITAGKGAFQPRTLGLDKEQEYKNIHYFVKKKDLFKDKKVVIFGGGDSAVDWANMLNGFAKEVSVVHRRDTFRAHEHSVENMMRSNVELFTSYVLDKVESKENKIHKVYLKSNKDDVGRVIDVDEVIVLYGFLSSLGPIEKWELSMEDRALQVDTYKQTNIEGIYAAGDACFYPGKVKMITSGFGEAIIAVNSIYGYIHPEKKNAAVFAKHTKK